MSAMGSIVLKKSTNAHQAATITITKQISAKIAREAVAHAMQESANPANPAFFNTIGSVADAMGYGRVWW